MRSVCFYFKIHQPYRLKRYRFFDIGNDHYYYDDFADDEIMSRLAMSSYIPMVDTLHHMVSKGNGQFKFSLSISGTAIEQMQVYAPELLEKLRALADTGCVEFLAGTYSHSLSSLEDPEEFRNDVMRHSETVYRIFGVRPTVFANTELIYDDDIALMIAAMGFETALTDGAKHVLGWKSPNYLYSAASVPSLKLLLTNDKLAQDISVNFNNSDWDEYPLTADKYMNWLASLPEEEQVVNLMFNMDTFGSFIPASSGIFEFLKALPYFAAEKGISLSTPSEVVKRMKSVGEVTVPFPISGNDEARDVSAWKGNTLQNEALAKLYSVSERVNLCQDRRLKQDWEYLQSSDHFFYMSTKNQPSAAFSPYDSPYDAFTNYMNVLADFMVRVEEQYPESIDNEELNSLLLAMKNQAEEITALKKEIKSLRTERDNAEVVAPKAEVVETVVVEEAPAVEAPKKKRTCAKKGCATKKTTKK